MTLGIQLAVDAYKLIGVHFNQGFFDNCEALNCYAEGKLQLTAAQRDSIFDLKLELLDYAKTHPMLADHKYRLLWQIVVGKPGTSLLR